MVRIGKRERASLGLPVSDDEPIPKRSRHLQEAAVLPDQAINQETGPGVTVSDKGEDTAVNKPATTLSLVEALDNNASAAPGGTLEVPIQLDTGENYYSRDVMTSDICCRSARWAC